jgi:hypothetical protein
MPGDGGEAWRSLQMAWRLINWAADTGGQGKVGGQSAPLAAASTGYD